MIKFINVKRLGVAVTALLAMSVGFSVASCNREKPNVPQKHEEKLEAIEKQVNKIAINTTNVEPIYKLYPTINMWNFLKLDTRNGKISIVQFSIKDSQPRLEYELSNKALCDNTVPGRFMLQPTENIYNFIMLDQVSGQTYQVQWSFEENGRFIIPIIMTE